MAHDLKPPIGRNQQRPFIPAVGRGHQVFQHGQKPGLYALTKGEAAQPRKLIQHRDDPRQQVMAVSHRGRRLIAARCYLHT